ncbi:putative uncharacterized protein DDB_G0291608 [Drosophila kikkawai]|uniref:Uncharacterized protein n=1 Tax=Drosophila kikkawai TaxID=30033 RepID=A0ABM4GQ12_DROKI
MNQKRINQMRSINRGQEQGLQQILQPMAASQLPQGQAGGNQAQQQQQQQSVRRKMTYTRTELLCRGLPTTQIPRRSPRTRGTYYQNNTIQQQQQQQHQSAVAPQTPLSAGPGNATSPMQSKPRSYLPRLSRLQSPNRNLTRKTEMDHHKPEKKTTPRVPNTPHASHCSISYTNPNPAPALGLGARNFRNEVSGIPVLDRNRNRNLKQRVEQRDINKEHIEVGNNTDTSSRSSRSSSPTDQSQVRVAKPILLPGEPQNKSFVYLCKPVKKVKELLTARQLRQSCENLKVKGYEGGETVGESLEPHKTNSEELLYSKAFEQGLELSSITEMSISPTSSTASQLQLQLQLPLQQLQQKQKQLQQLEDSNQQRLMSQLTTRHQQYRHQHQGVCHNDAARPGVSA